MSLLTAILMCGPSTRSGSTPVPSGPYTYAPAQNKWQDAGAELADGSYTRRNSYAQLAFTTAASTVEVQIYSSFYAANAAGVFIVYCNGTHQAVTIPSAGPAWVTIPGLPSGSKNIVVYSGESVRPGGSGAVVGTNILGVRTDDAQATFTTYTAPANRYLVVGDSITIGGGASYGWQAWTMLLRDRMETAHAGKLTLEGVSADSLTEVTGSSGLRSAAIARHAAELDGTGSNTLLMELGTNDCGLGKASASAFQTLVAAYADDFHTARPDVTFYWITPITCTNYDPSAYRAAINTVAGTRPWLNVIDGTTLVSSGQLADGLHPSVAGHVSYESAIADVLGL